MSEFLFVYLIICGFIIIFSGRSLVSYFVYFCSIYSFFSLVYFDFGFLVPFDLGAGLTEEFITLPIFIFATSAVCFSLGQKILFNSRFSKLSSFNHTIFFKIDDFKSNLYCFFPILTAILVISSIGFSSLLERNSYVVYDANLTFRKFADITVWLAILATPFIKNKKLMFFSHIFLLLSLAGLGSRSAMVVGFAFPVFNYFINNSRKAFVFINIILVSILSIVVMNIRFKSQQGIIPVFYDIMSLNFDLTVGLYLLNYLTSYSVLLFSEYLNSHVVNYSFFLMSISPLPGFMLDIDGIDQWARFRKSIPHSAISQLYGHAGLFVVFGYFFIKGYLCGYLKRKVIITYGSSAFINSSLILVELLFLVPVLRGMQYNIRGVARLEYLVMGIYFFIIFFLYVVRLRRNKGKL